jgi:Ca2+-binding RTX toxin-like protein
MLRRMVQIHMLSITHTPVRSIRFAIMFACAALFAACGAGSDDATRDAESVEGALSHGGGAGPAIWDSDPCADPAHYAATHGLHLIVAAPNEHEIVGTAGNDFIVGTNGDDEIWGRTGADFVCAGRGEDTVHGEAGNDYLDGGGENDHLFGDADDDVIHGRGGGDYVFGGEGNDALFGDILDDHLYGENGSDLLVGGHGTDVMMGGAGQDYLRGDTGNDAFIGGDDLDVASFATAMPPGQGQLATAPPLAVDGVKVDFSNDCSATGFDPSELGGKSTHDGCANGDGGNEPLDGIEIVVGSPYADAFTSGGEPKHFFGGYGDDRCDGIACGRSLPTSSDAIVVFVDPIVRDTGLIVVGASAADDLEIFAAGTDLRVRSRDGGKLVAGPGCGAVSDGLRCTVDHTLRYVAAYGAGGDDVVHLGVSVAGASELPRDFTAHVAGGDGSDSLFGGDEEDVLFSGPTGADHLFGNDGDDALLSESRKWPAKDCSAMTAAARASDPRCDEDKPSASAYTDGADELRGGAGDDQLVADYPCGNHLYSGGGGVDVAGFARSGSFDIVAQLAGTATIVKSFSGRAFNPDLCGEANGTRFVDDLEILEASSGNDLLYGNDAPNVIWGRAGNDRIHGLAGDDVLAGLQGDDMLYGGAGNDVLLGGGGNDQLFPDAN